MCSPEFNVNITAEHCAESADKGGNSDCTIQIAHKTQMLQGYVGLLASVKGLYIASRTLCILSLLFDDFSLISDHLKHLAVVLVRRSQEWRWNSCDPQKCYIDL